MFTGGGRGGARRVLREGPKGYQPPDQFYIRRGHPSTNAEALVLRNVRMKKQRDFKRGNKTDLILR